MRPIRYGIALTNQTDPGPAFLLFNLSLFKTKSGCGNGNAKLTYTTDNT